MFDIIRTIKIVKRLFPSFSIFEQYLTAPDLILHYRETRYVLKKYHHPRKEDFELCSVLNALSDPARLEIVKSLLKKGECACSSFNVPLAKSTLSHHFKVLRDAGLITTRVKCTEYGLSVRKDELDDVFPGLLDSIIRASSR
jgi:DNA-binding transcriptional ArsR family regulator